MTTITIFGNGNMGSAIGGLFSSGGAEVSHVTHAGSEPITGDIVVLAVPYESLQDIVKDYADQFAGRIVVDITNPLDFDTFDSLKVPAGSSAAAELQNALPHSKILKAFNTNFAATLSDQQVGINPTTVLVAGDDDAAKQTFSGAVVAGGMPVVDVGKLVRAHELEALGFLQLTLANNDTIAWSAGFALVR